MPRKRRVLIIDPDDSHVETWKTELGEKFHVTYARSLPDAKEILAESPEFAVIAIESFLEGDTIRSIPFIENLRAIYRKPIIGIAIKYQQQQQMIIAGCNLYTIRYNLPNKICEALQIYSPIKATKRKYKVKKSFRKTLRKTQDQAAQ